MEHVRLDVVGDDTALRPGRPCDVRRKGIAAGADLEDVHAGCDAASLDHKGGRLDTAAVGDSMKMNHLSTGDEFLMERNEAYSIALVAGAVAVIIAVALMVPYVTGTDTGANLL